VVPVVTAYGIGIVWSIQICVQGCWTNEFDPHNHTGVCAIIDIIANGSVSNNIYGAMPSTYYENTLSTNSHGLFWYAHVDPLLYICCMLAIERVVLLVNPLLLVKPNADALVTFATMCCLQQQITNGVTYHSKWGHTTSALYSNFVLVFLNPNHVVKSLSICAITMPITRRVTSFYTRLLWSYTAECMAQYITSHHSTDFMFLSSCLYQHAVTSCTH